MQHRGEIVEKAIRDSGIPITTITKKLGKTRQWVYLMFDNPSVPLDTVIALGRVIYHDFSSEIDFNITSSTLNESKSKMLPKENSTGYWKEKYYELLEENHTLYKRISELEKAK